MVKRALFSLFDTRNVFKYAQALLDLGWQIIATRETVEFLAHAGIKVMDVASFVGVEECYPFPPTLHPKIEAALTTESESRIDLVYDIPYPKNIGNDVGGRTLLALAAKGNRIAVTCPEDMEEVINLLRQYGYIPDSFRRELIDRVNANIAAHYLNLVRNSEAVGYEGFIARYEFTLLNGENPYQVPAYLYSSYEDDPLALHQFKRRSGEVPCYTNLADMDSIIRTICLIVGTFNSVYHKTPNVAIGAKHGNPCGLAIDWQDPKVAIEKALFGNPRGIWGGEFITNFEIDEGCASKLLRSELREKLCGKSAWMLDIIAAPSFSERAVEILGQRRQRKLFENFTLNSPRLPSQPRVYRHVRGGILVQPPPNYVLDPNSAEAVGSLDQERVLEDLIIAWAVAWNSNHGGNEVALAKEGQLIGVGGGPSTADSALTAVTRARSAMHETRSSVFAANAFFPSTDGPQMLGEAGCMAGLVPAGGQQEHMVREYFLENAIGMLYLPERCRGFNRH